MRIVNIYFLKLKSLLQKPLIRSLILVAFISILIKVTGFYKETIVAASFGLSELLDTFIIAVLIPTFFQNVFVNSLSNLFLPNYVTELKTTNRKSAFQSVSFLIVTALIFLLSLVCILFVEYFLHLIFPNHKETYYGLIKTQFYYILPCLIFWGYSSLLISLLEIKSKFLYSSISPIFTTITTILCLTFFRDKFQEAVLAIGMLSGSIISFLYLLGLCIYYKELDLGKPAINKNIRNMISQLPPKVTSGLLTGSNSVVDKFFAAQLVTGSIAALNYGSKVPAFVVGMLIMPLSSVLLPHFAKSINEDLGKAYNQLFRILKWVFFASLVIVLLGIAFSEETVRLLYERKEFTSEDTEIVSNIQQIAFVFIPFHLCTLICVKFLTAINRNKFMAWTSFWNLGVNLVLNYIFTKYFGVYGLALSTTLVYILSSLIYLSFTYRQFKTIAPYQ